MSPNTATIIRAREQKATCCEIFMCILIPPVGMAMIFGCGIEVCFSLFLCCLGFIPGVIYSLYMATTNYPQPDILVFQQSQSQPHSNHQIMMQPPPIVYSQPQMMAQPSPIYPPTQPPSYR